MGRAIRTFGPRGPYPPRVRLSDPEWVQAEDLDDLVQRLAVAKYALVAGDQAAATEAVDAALALARRLMTRGHAGDSLLRSRATPSD
jgi:hypothetical protein